MYELVQISEKCYYINCLTKIGVYAADKNHGHRQPRTYHVPCKNAAG